MFQLKRDVVKHVQGAVWRGIALRNFAGIQHPHSVNRIGLLPAVLLCASLGAFAQTDWTRQFGTANNDDARAVAMDGTGVYVLYASYGVSGQSTEYLAKYSLDGSNLLFTRQIGGPGAVRPAGLAVTSDSIYVAGATDVSLGGQTSLGQTDGYLQRYDLSGNLLWTRQFGTTGYDDAAGVAVDATGIYVAGSTAGTLPGGASAGGPDAYLMKYDSSGNLLWTRQVGTSSADSGRAVTADGTGVYFTGWAGAALAGQTQVGGVDAFLQKYNSSGGLEWTRQFGSASFDAPSSVTLSGGAVYVTGYTQGQFPGQSVYGGGADGFVQKFDLSGAAQWARQFGTSSYDYADASAIDGTGIAVGGLTGGTFPGQTSSGGNDAYVLKFDSAGALSWTRQFGSSGQDRVAGAVSSGSRLYLAGTVGTVLAGQTSLGGSDVFVQSTGAIAAQGELSYVPITPCRLSDSRPGQGKTGSFGPPSFGAGETRIIPVPQGTCSIPNTARAYALNVTVVPVDHLQYLTLYPAGEVQPLVSTLNSFHGGIVANAAIAPAGANGAIAVYTTDATDVIIDINGYFIEGASASAYSFYTVQPCRAVDTREAAGALGGPALQAGQGRNFPIADSICGLPYSATAYSVNATVVPPAPLGYLTMWPVGQGQPFVSTLNSLDGSIVANAAFVQSGPSGIGISAFATDTTHLAIDVNGYFAPPGGANELKFHAVTPCRVADTRLGLFGSAMAAGSTRDFTVGSVCGVPTTARAYSLNVTAVPSGPLAYLTLWPSGSGQPLVSTLNSYSGRIVANAAIVPAGVNSAVSVYVTDQSHVVLDVNGYFQ